jgi:hypothetical protein
MEKELILKHIKVVFAELEDKGFGTSITVDVTDQAAQDAISKWVADNNINGGKAKFKDYTNKDGETTKQYNFKISKFTEIAGPYEGELGYGAEINLVARPYTYDNQFGKGTSASLSAVFVTKPRIHTTMDKIAEE